LENDDDSLVIKTIQLGGPAHFLKITADKQFDFKKEARDGGAEDEKELRLNLYVVSGGAIHVIKILQTSPRTFDITGHQQFPYEHKGDNLYVKHLKDPASKQEYIFICNFPADYRDFMVD